MTNAISDSTPFRLIEEGVYKYVVKAVPKEEPRTSTKRVMIFDTDTQHESMVCRASGDKVLGAGFIAIPERGSFFVQDANSGSLNHKGDPQLDEGLIASLTGLKCVRPKLESDAEETKVLTRHYAFIDYGEASAICKLHDLDIDSILHGFAFYIPQTRVRVSFEARKRGWMISAYCETGDDVVRVLQSVSCQGRVHKATPDDPFPIS
jgi:hypothetical protein